MFRFRGLVLLVFFVATAASPAQQRITPRMSHAFSPHRSATAPRALRLPDTVRLLAVMVDFQEDSDDRTSGTGKFGTIYEYDYGTEILDPMPHDRAFFEQHLLFLENYVRKVSGRTTILKGEVLDGVVTMNMPLGEYSFRNEESEAPVARLAVDAWTAAGQQFPTASFGDYDMFVVFHAGRGRDVDLVSVQGFDPTPLDIPSLSFTMDSFQRLLGASFSGIAMPDGSTINNCAIIPTTNNREIPLLDGSVGLLELTINGLLAASFGTWAGLPDLFDTASGKTGIGRFGLMDGEGIFAYGGICPPEPSAWEKQLLGWTIAREAMPGKNNYLLTASDSLTTPDVLRIPINGDEYWLVENRQRDLGGNGQSVTIVSGGQTQTLRFPKDTTGFQSGDVSQLKGVIIDVEDIDWSLPGGRVIADEQEARINGGLLIWHIDERIIAEHRVTNTVNTGKHARGVDLEQAGGPQDIGVDIQTVFGTETGTGSPLDYWTRDNISPVYTNSFGMFTSPNTRTNSGAFSHVTMDGFSKSGPIMSVDVALGDNTIAPMPGWPVDLGEHLTEGDSLRYVQTADIDADGAEEIMFVSSGRTSGQTQLFILRQDGSSYLSTGIQAFEKAGSGFVSSGPAIGDVDSDGNTEIILVTGEDDGQAVVVLSHADTDSDGKLDIEQEYLIRKEIASHPEVSLAQIIHGAVLLQAEGSGMRDSLYVIRDELKGFEYQSAGLNIDWACENCRAVSFNELDGTLFFAENESASLIGDVATGSPVEDLPWNASRSVRLPALVHAYSVGVDMNGDAKTDAALIRNSATSSLFYVAGSWGEGLVELPSELSYLGSDLHALSAGDVDGDGRMEVLLSGSDGVSAVNYSLSSVDHFPTAFEASQSLVATDPGGMGDVVFISGPDRLWQLQTGARMVSGFPVPLPHDAEVALLKTHNEQLGILAASADGNAYLFETNRGVDDEDFVWKSRFGNARNSLTVEPRGSTPPPIENFFPEERCYNWPNPAYDAVTYIRLYVSEDANVTIKIYDLAGDKVDEISAQAVGGTDTDIPWNVKDVQSDVYIARVEAVAGSQTGEKIIKIAVVR